MSRLVLVPLVLIACVATSALAQDRVGVEGVLYEVKGGLLYHDVDHLWSGSRRESGVDVNLEAVFAPKLDVLGGAIRPALGGSINTTGDTSMVYLDARWEYSLPANLYVALGLGAALHDGKLKAVDAQRKALGSRILFHVPVEVGYRFDGHHGVSVYFDHVSNGFFADPNEGMDTLGLRYGYRF